MTIATDYEIPQEILNGLSPAVLAALLEEQAENDDNKFSLDELVTNERNTELELVKSEEKDNQFSAYRWHPAKQTRRYIKNYFHPLCVNRQNEGRRYQGSYRCCYLFPANMRIRLVCRNRFRKMRLTNYL